ncbi:MAG: recombinase family protein [Sandaracinaceae bacterium]|nr:recombinase family protein [Sandaracinaceae bacterium]
MDDQIRTCCQHVERRGGKVLTQTYSLTAPLAARSRGAGIESLVRAAHDKQFDCVVVEDISRLSRNLGDGARLREQLEFAGIRLIAINDGVDSTQEGSEFNFNMKLVIGQHYLRALGEATRRGLRGRANRGLATGLVAYGYRVQTDTDGHRRIEVDEVHAAVVQRIFGECAAGRPLAAIARGLNADEIPPPRGKGKRTRPGWVLTGVRSILLNERYTGTWRYNERKFQKRPGTNKRVARLRHPSEVSTNIWAHLRIVSDEVWSAARVRFANNKARYLVREQESRLSSFGRPGKPSNYLLSGLLVCGVCGAR